TWIAALLHAAWRSAPVARALPNPAWREQAIAIGVLAPAAALLNWITTGDHPLRPLATRYWPAARVDPAPPAVAAAGGASALRAARRHAAHAAGPAYAADAEARHA